MMEATVTLELTRRELEDLIGIITQEKQRATDKMEETIINNIDLTDSVNIANKLSDTISAIGYLSKLLAKVQVYKKIADKIDYEKMVEEFNNSTSTNSHIIKAKDLPPIAPVPTEIPVTQGGTVATITPPVRRPSAINLDKLPVVQAQPANIQVEPLRQMDIPSSEMESASSTKSVEEDGPKIKEKVFSVTKTN